MLKNLVNLFTVMGLLLAANASTQANESIFSQSPANAAVYFIEPADGAVLPQTFTVKFGLAGMGVAPAGVEREHTGHHHLLINMDEMPDLNLPLPATEQVVHYGGGQTEAQITLPPGQHTLQLLLGNHYHIPHRKPVMSKKITITVAD